MENGKRTPGDELEVLVCRAGVDVEAVLKSVGKRYPSHELRITLCGDGAELTTALERRLRESRTGEGRFAMKTAMGLRLLPLARIVCCRSEGHRFHVWMEDGETVSSLTIRYSFGKATETLIGSGCFLRCNASAVVNLAFVKLVREGELVLTDGTVLSFPAHRQAEARGLLGALTGRCGD